QRLVGPGGRERRILFDLVQPVEDRPCAVGCDRQALLNVFDWLVHALNLRARVAYEDYISSERSPRAANGHQPQSDGHDTGLWSAAGAKNHGHAPEIFARGCSYMHELA